METEKQTITKSVGTLLKEARLAKGLSLEAVEAATHIYVKNLEHLENDEYDKTPGEFFVKGALRNYGNFLGLNGPELVDMYKASIAGKALHEVEAHGIREAKNVTMNIQFKDKRDIGSGSSSFEFMEKLRDVKLPWKQIAMGAAGLAVLGVLYFAVPAVINWGSNISFSSSSAEKPQVKPATISEKKEAKPVVDKLVLELEATDKCWLEVYGDDKKLEETMLNPGDKKSYEAKDKFDVKYGNVGAVKITLNGEAQSTEGEHGVAKKVYLRERPADEAKSEEQKTDAKVESTPKAEETQVRTPAKVEEAPKVEAPKVEEPAKVEAPKAKEPVKVEAPKVEEPAKVEPPKEEAKPSKKDKKK